MAWGNRGGGNPGNRGRPTLSPGQRLVVVHPSISETQREWTVKLGGGNLSLGVRKAIAQAMQSIAPAQVAALTARARADDAAMALATAEESVAAAAAIAALHARAQAEEIAAELAAVAAAEAEAAEARKPRCSCKDIEDEPDCPIHGLAPIDTSVFD